MDLSVSINKRSGFGGIDVSDLLNNFVVPEQMEKCGYRCSKCKAVDKAEKQMTIFRFPKILVIHLKRFSRREKISTSIGIPGTLNMREYKTPGSNHSSLKQADSYKLYGISHHSGSLNGGHYVGEVMNVDDRKWYNCNDSHVSQSRSGADKSSSSAYVLFYVRQ